jgi:hypothetical protein
LFVEFRATFDKVDREKMFESMRERERGISKWLVRKIEEIYARRRNKVKVGEQEGEWFGTTKGVRQDCLLSPLGLSTIYVCGRYRPNVKESKRRGRSMVGRERKILVIVAKRERNERNDEESGKVCEEEKKLECVQQEKEEE